MTLDTSTSTRTPIGPTRHRGRHRRLSLVRVPRPEQWWIAAQEDLPLPPRAPDDGAHGDERDLPRWAAVAAAVQGVGRALVTGACTHDPEEPGVALVPVNVAALDRLGRAIVRSWFQAGPSAPCGEPGAAQREDRLHWLAHAWDALPNAQLPVRSELLMRLEDVPELGDAFAPHGRPLGERRSRAPQHDHRWSESPVRPRAAKGRTAHGAGPPARTPVSAGPG